MENNTDGSLVLRILAGESDVYSTLVASYQFSVFNVCYRLLGDSKDAEDIAQDSFIRAFQRLETFDINRPFGPWIRRIATNLCINFLKRRHWQGDIELNDESDYRVMSKSINPEIALENSEKRDLIRLVLLDLSPNYRIAIELRHFQDMTYEEMANHLNLPLNTVKSNLFRARKKLLEIMKEASYVS